MTGSSAAADVAVEVGGQQEVSGPGLAVDAGVAAEECVPIASVEDCTNGIDDDCNGLTDCQDPACGAYRCAFSPGPGWLGPVALWEGSPVAGAPPPCPPGYDTPMDWTGNLDAPPLTCSCSCAASGERCVSTIGRLGADMACGLPCAVQIVTTACTALTNGGTVCGFNFSFDADPPAPTGGTCTPTLRKSIPGKPAWTTAARTCTLVGIDKPGGCNGGNAQCLLTPAAPYGAATCVYQITPNGDMPPTACPDGFTSKPKLFYSPSSVISDTRDCSPCTCSGPNGGSCAGTIAIFGGTTCAGPAATYTLGSGCNRESIANNPTPSHLVGSYTLTPGSCGVAVDTAPSGAARLSGTTTVVCCM